jgi:hypothetical protein
MFDTYTIKARINPIVIFALPGFLLLVIYSVKLDALQPILYSAAITSAITFLLSQIGRQQGKKKEKKLWEDWGGTPTIQLLRWRNQVIPSYVKKRYHAALQERVPEAAFPDPAFESQFPVEADEIYAAWSHYLRVETRDTKTWNLIFKENINYGFRRNLWGMKPAAIMLLLLLSIGNYFYNVFLYESYNLICFTKSFWLANGILVVFWGMWIFVITKDFVRVTAFAYAERLLEASTKLS